MTPSGTSVLGALAPFLFGAIALLLLAILRSWRVHDRGVDMFLAIGFILAAAIIAGSADLGTDAAAYRERFDQLLLLHGDTGWWEPGFEYVALLFAKMGAPYGVFVFVTVLVSHLLELHVYSRVCTEITLAFFVLFCFNLGEIAFVREYLAASILLLSFYFLHQGRAWRGILLILCATLVHKTAFPVGGVVLLLTYGRKAMKPMVALLLAVALLYIMLPPQVEQSLITRVAVQTASYTAQGFVQGLQAEDVSLFRNVAKFLIYGLLGLWMLMVPVRTLPESMQAKAAHLVLALSAVSLILILGISPVFSRLSIYVFPFLALAMRAERFSPRYSQVPVQLASVTILLANLYISMYPLAPFL